MSDDPEIVRHVARQDYENSRLDAAERVKIQATLADRLLQALLLANGGAMVALFTFVGSISAGGKGATIDSGYMKSAFGFFAFGLFLALIAHLLAFWSQDRFFNQSTLEMWRHQKTSLDGVPRGTSEAEMSLFTAGRAAYFGGLAVAVVCIMLFVIGCWSALLGVSV